MAAPSFPLAYLLTATALAAAVLLAYRRLRGRRSAGWRPAGRVVAVNVFPLKSGAARRCRRARVTRFGMRCGAELDRCLAVVTDGKMVCASFRRRVVLISASIAREGDVTEEGADVTEDCGSGEGKVNDVGGGGDTKEDAGSGEGRGDGVCGEDGRGEAADEAADGGATDDDATDDETADGAGLSVTLTAPGTPPLTLPLPARGDDVTVIQGRQFDVDNDGVDLGEAAAGWLGRHFADGGTYRLMYFLDGTVRPRRTRDLPREYARLAAATDVAAFQNVTALSVICDASVTELNRRLERPVTADNFRHNLVVGGAPAFADDRWRRLKVGSALMRRVKPIQRCPNTCVDPQTAERSATTEPLRTLRTFRLPATEEERRMYGTAPLLGSALGVDREGEVAVGDVVYVME